MKDIPYDNLTERQKDQIWHGKACGHPSNKPANERAARRILWTINGTNNVVGKVHTTTLNKFF